MDKCLVKVVDDNKVNIARLNIESLEYLNEMAKLYKIFGDQTRLRIINVLSNNELCVCEIEDLLGLSQSLISHQLKKLREANVVKVRREAKKVYYSLSDSHVLDIYNICLTHIKNCK